MKLVSVVIPTHFRPDRLINAINSVQNQNYRNLEIIVVSDGYDVETERIVKDKEINDSRVHFFYYPHSQGGNHARNVGIEHANGEYIAFIDDDDIWYTEKVKMQVQILEGCSDIGLVGCGINVLHVDKGISYKTLFKDKGDLSKKILYSNIIGSTSCVMVRKEAIENCGLFDEIMPARQDYDLWIRICQKYLVDFVDSVQLDYCVYDSNGKSQQVSKSLDKYICAHEILMEKYNYLYNKLSPEEYKIFMADRYLGVAQRALEVGNSRIASEYGRKAWKQKGSIKALWFMRFSWIPYSILVKIRALIH